MADPERNKQVVVDYYTTAFAGNPEKAVADHFGPQYIQHNPDAQDGPEAFIGFVKWLRGEYPNVQLHIKRVIARATWSRPTPTLTSSLATPTNAVGCRAARRRVGRGTARRSAGPGRAARAPGPSTKKRSTPLATTSRARCAGRRARVVMPARPQAAHCFVVLVRAALLTRRSLRRRPARCATRGP